MQLNQPLNRQFYYNLLLKFFQVHAKGWSCFGPLFFEFIKPPTATRLHSAIIFCVTKNPSKKPLPTYDFGEYEYFVICAKVSVWKLLNSDEF